MAGYEQMGEVLTPAVRQAIYGFAIYVPIVLYVVMLIMISRFDLPQVLAAHRAKQEQNQ